MRLALVDRLLLVICLLSGSGPLGLDTVKGLLEEGGAPAAQPRVEQIGGLYFLGFKCCGLQSSASRGC